MRERTEYITKRKALFWSVGDIATVSDSLLVETILNYGSIKDVKDLFEVMDLEKVAEIFFKATTQNKRHNYFPPVENFFRLYFQRHVHKRLVA